jgi:hypothetical protein
VHLTGEVEGLISDSLLAIAAIDVWAMLVHNPYANGKMAEDWTCSALGPRSHINRLAGSSRSRWLSHLAVNANMYIHIQVIMYKTDHEVLDRYMNVCHYMVSGSPPALSLGVLDCGPLGYWYTGGVDIMLYVKLNITFVIISPNSPFQYWRQSCSFSPLHAVYRA